MFPSSESHADNLIKNGIFNVEDLEINRSGHLSDRQKRNLYFGISGWLLLAVLEISIWILLFAVNKPPTGWLGIALFPALIYLFLKEADPFWKDIKEDDPRSVAGELYKDFRLTRGFRENKALRRGTCSIRVGREVFPVPPSLYDQLMDEDLYRIYYVQHTRKIMNIEPL